VGATGKLALPVPFACERHPQNKFEGGTHRARKPKLLGRSQALAAVPADDEGPLPVHATHVNKKGLSIPTSRPGKAIGADPTAPV